MQIKLWSDANHIIMYDYIEITLYWNKVVKFDYIEIKEYLINARMKYAKNANLKELHYYFWLIISIVALCDWQWLLFTFVCASISVITLLSIKYLILCLRDLDFLRIKTNYSREVSTSLHRLISISWSVHKLCFYYLK